MNEISGSGIRLILCLWSPIFGYEQSYVFGGCCRSYVEPHLCYTFFIVGEQQLVAPNEISFQAILFSKYQRVDCALGTACNLVKLSTVVVLANRNDENDDLLTAKFAFYLRFCRSTKL